MGLAVGVGSITAAITLGGVGAAQADPGNCGTAAVEHSLDGGQTWTADGRMDGGKAPTVIEVRLKDTPADGCAYTVSLSSYSAEGPKWDSSGHQDFLGWDTVTLNKDKTQATLDVSKYAPTCFGQVDLYGNGTEYDGGTGEGHGPLPNYKENIATPFNLITAWNGGSACQTPTPTPTTQTPTPTPTATTGTPTPTESTATPTPSPTATTGTPTPSPSVSDTSSPSPTPTGPTSTTPPSGSPSVPPATSASGSGNLAETGGNGSQNVAFAGGGAALLVLGGAAVYFTRRRHSGTHS